MPAVATAATGTSKRPINFQQQLASENLADLASLLQTGLAGGHNAGKRKRARARIVQLKHSTKLAPTRPAVAGTTAAATDTLHQQRSTNAVPGATTRIVPRGKGLTAGIGSVSVMSWNVLHDHPGCGWPARRDNVVAELTTCGADIIALQEVLPHVFANDLEPALNAAGYAGIHSTRRQLVVFWRDRAYALLGTARTFTLVGHSQRSRTLTAVLQDRHAHRLAVVNCHLEGHPGKVVARVKQLQSTLTELARAHSHHAVVVCGDFNCALQSSECTNYLARCVTPREMPATAATSTIRHHTHQVWEAASATDAAGIAKLPAHQYQLAPASAVHRSSKAFTYSDRPGQTTAGIDQVWFSSDSLVCVAERALFRSEQHRQHLLTVGLPCAANASDHVPVGAVFRWTDDARLLMLTAPAAVTATAADTAQAATTGAAITALPCLQLQDDACTIPAAPASMRTRGPACHPAADAAALLKACTLTVFQRSTFALATQPVAGMSHTRTKTRKRPTDMQLEALQAQRSLREELLGEVADDVRCTLQTVFKLYKLHKLTSKIPGGE